MRENSDYSGKTPAAEEAYPVKNVCQILGVKSNAVLLSGLKGIEALPLKQEAFMEEEVFHENGFVLTGRVAEYHPLRNGKCIYVIHTVSGMTAMVHVWGEPKPEFGKHLRVIIRGHAESYGRPGKNSSRTSQRLVADSIEREKTLVEQAFPELNVKGHFSGTPCFEYQIAGKVLYYEEENGFLHMTIRTKTPDGRSADIPVSMRTPDRIEKIQPGDMVCAKCGIYTMKKGYETLTAGDIGKVS